MKYRIRYHMIVKLWAFTKPEGQSYEHFMCYLVLWCEWEHKHM